MKRIKRKTLLEEKIGCHEWMMYDESQKMVYLLNDNAFLFMDCVRILLRKWLSKSMLDRIPDWVFLQE